MKFSRTLDIRFVDTKETINIPPLLSSRNKNYEASSLAFIFLSTSFYTVFGSIVNTRDMRRFSILTDHIFFELSDSKPTKSFSSYVRPRTDKSPTIRRYNYVNFNEKMKSTTCRLSNAHIPRYLRKFETFRCILKMTSEMINDVSRSLF